LDTPFLKHQYKFHDVDTFAHHISQGVLQYYQLEPGSFHGELTEIISQKIIVSTHKMNRIVQQVGTGIEGFTTFLLPGNMSQDFNWRAIRLTGKRIGVLKSKMKHFMISRSDFFGTPISINNEYFNELILKLKYDESIYKIIQQKEVIEISFEDAYQMQQVVVKLCNEEKEDIDLLTNVLPRILLKSIENISDGLSQQISKPKDILYNKSIEYINLHLGQKITIGDICSTINTSERNLRYIFKEITGLSPMRYIKSLKLNKVRKDIIDSGVETGINLIASNWGFSHSGQFAADYKKLFGELPSETYRRAKK